MPYKQCSVLIMYSIYKKRRGRDSPSGSGYRFRILRPLRSLAPGIPAGLTLTGVRSDRIPDKTSASKIILSKMYYPYKKNGEGGIRTLGTRNGYNSLAGSPIQPLSHLSSESTKKYGEGGIRTHGRLHVNSFQDCLLRPLGHLSINCL